MLGVSPSSGYELMHEPDFPMLKVGSRMVVPKEKFVEWLDRADGVEQIAVAFQTASGGDCRALCTDELPLLQLAHILTDGVRAHLHRSADGLVAGPALVGVSVLAAEQIGVDRQRTGRQPQQEYLVGQLEVVLDRVSRASAERQRKNWLNKKGGQPPHERIQL